METHFYKTLRKVESSYSKLSLESRIKHFQSCQKNHSTLIKFLLTLRAADKKRPRSTDNESVESSPERTIIPPNSPNTGRPNGERNCLVRFDGHGPPDDGGSSPWGARPWKSKATGAPGSFMQQVWRAFRATPKFVSNILP